VIANDISPAATEAMRRNVELNGLGPQQPQPTSPTEEAASIKGRRPDQGKVRVSEMDAV
jgi:tRNA (guanine26-N2/guanine27-N2)-dimethyltransferase